MSSSLHVILLIPFIYYLNGKNPDYPNRKDAIRFSKQNIIQDTIPPLHTIRDKDIKTLTPSFEQETITIVLKNGNTYIYSHLAWDYEDVYPSLSKRVKEAMKGITKTFTTAEEMPDFPGGQEAWNNYIYDFSQKNKSALKSAGSGECLVQFVVHLYGQVSDLTIIQNFGSSKLASLAMKSIQEGPAWIPATQNGRFVICYQRQLVRLK